MMARRSMLSWLASLPGALLASAPRRDKRDSRRLTDSDFRRLMDTVALGWNQGDARKSADCFTDDAVYMDPPDRQVYHGRPALYEFFGGAKRPQPPMHMMWHHLAFDSSSQVGFGEYTFAKSSQYHGVVVVKIVSRKISSWREYQYRSDLSWTLFTGRGYF